MPAWYQITSVTYTFWVWIIFPLEAAVPQRRIVTQRREYKKKMVLIKWNKFCNVTMLSRQAERSDLVIVMYPNETVVMVKRFATSGGSWDFLMARLGIGLLCDY
jgi:hypothetical protein